jgi:hypothetical protein
VKQRLRNAAAARVDDAKVYAYLLNPAHPQNGGKAGFFALFGYTLPRWTVLQQALLLHAVTGWVSGSERSVHGEKFVVSGPLPSPDGRAPNLDSIWIIDRGAAAPRFVTAYPAAKDKPG